jgi:hypothetical protein
MKAQVLLTSIRVLAIGLLAVSVLQCKAQLTGEIQARRIDFVNGGTPIAADGTGTVKNANGEIVASGRLIINNGTMAILGTRGAVFTYVPKPTASSPTNWPDGAPANVALVDFDGKNKWTLKDDQFLFMLKLGDNFQGIILVDNSLLSSSCISFPEGKYSMWGYSITAGSGGGAVVFKQGQPVDGDNMIVETPEMKKLEFPRKTK